MSGESERRAVVAVGLIVAGDGRVLLQHRDDRPEVSGAGLWGLFGGHVEAGESLTGAFLREMEEELGWRPAHLEHYLTSDIPPLPADKGYGHHVTSHVFAAHLDRRVEELRLGEGQAMALYAPDALPAAIVPGLVPVIREFARSDAYRRVKRSWDLISTTGLLVDGDGRFLLQLRDERDDIMHPGMWGSFGGRLEPYETPDEGFLRELEEELGWRPRSHELYMSAPLRTLGADDDRSQLIYIYAAPIDVPIESMVLGEGQALDAFPPGALPANTVPALRGLIERFAATPAYGAVRSGARM